MRIFATYADYEDAALPLMLQKRDELMKKSATLEGLTALLAEARDSMAYDRLPSLPDALAHLSRKWADEVLDS